jgi:hypothetical protein
MEHAIRMHRSVVARWMVTVSPIGVFQIWKKMATTRRSITSWQSWVNESRFHLTGEGLVKLTRTQDGWTVANYSSYF